MGCHFQPIYSVSSLPMISPLDIVPHNTAQNNILYYDTIINLQPLHWHTPQPLASTTAPSGDLKPYRLSFLHPPPQQKNQLNPLHLCTAKASDGKQPYYDKLRHVARMKDFHGVFLLCISSAQCTKNNVISNRPSEYKILGP